MKRRVDDWMKVAERLGEALPRACLYPEVLAWADARPIRERWAIAFSGGADSTALLLLLWAHWPKRRDRLLALHFDHGLRGKDSKEDARFCGQVCAGLGVSLANGRWMRPPKVASEAAARAERFGFFQQQLKRRRIKALWLGQQQNDVAETILMRIARGSGTAGLAAPRPLHDHPEGRIHLRPLLSLKKSEILSALAAAGAEWREDASNEGGEFFRNRLRRDVLPAWCAAAGRDALAGAGLSRELMAEDDAALEQWLDQLGPVAKDGSLEIEVLRGMPRAIVRRALHRWLGIQPRLGELSRQGFERLLAAVEQGRDTRQSLGRITFARIRKGRLVAEFFRGSAD